MARKSHPRRKKRTRIRAKARPVKKLPKSRLPLRIRTRLKKKVRRREQTVRSNGRAHYILNPGFEFLTELRNLILKSSPAEKDRMVERMNALGRIKLAVVSGIFMNKEPKEELADLLIVGEDIDRRKLMVFLKALEAEVGKEIKFAVMEKDEFQYRLSMFDRFVWVMLESPHEKLINRLGI